MSAMPMRVKEDLTRIPGMGPSIAADLYRLGIHEVAELRGRNPEAMYEETCRLEGAKVDRCVLYVYRCAVYFASEAKPEKELLQWWKWKDQAEGERARTDSRRKSTTRSKGSKPKARAIGARRLELALMS